MQVNTTVYTMSIFAAACITSGLVYAAGSKFGPGLTFDSVNYLYAGHSLWEKGKLLRPFEKPFIEWPLLFPTVLALLFAGKLPVLKSVFYLQIIISGVSVFMAGKLAKEIIREPVVFFTALVAICFSTPVVLVNHFIWSESLFVLLSLLYIKALIVYVKGLKKKYLWIIMGVGMLLCLQRYVGVFFVVAGVVILWKYAFGKSFLSPFILGGLQVLPVAIWCIYNYVSYATFMNKEMKFPREPFTYAGNFSQVFTSWLIPDEISQWLALFLFILLLGFLLNHFIQTNMASERKDLVIIGSIFFFYLILSLAGSFITSEEVEDRKFAIVYITGILFIFGLLDQYILCLQNRKFKIVIYALCLLWTVYPISRTLYNTYRWHHQQTGLPQTQPVENSFAKMIMP